MSEAAPVSDVIPHTRYLSEPQKQAIIARIALGESQPSLAKRFNVHINTIYRLSRSVRKAPGSPLSTDWRRKLTDQLPAQCVDAIELSVTDKKDIHRAANTATTVLKGLGHLQGETTTSVNVFLNSISNLPNDLQDEFVSVGHTINSQPDE